MERLTNKREADAQRKEYERRLANGYPRNIPEERFLRLAAYEDIGLMPEEIKAPFTDDIMINLAAQALRMKPDRLRELAEADKDGRLAVWPCKVGDVVFARLDNKSKYVCECKVKQIVVGNIGFVTFAPIKEFAGIESRPTTEYNHYDENGEFIGSSVDTDLCDLLDEAGVEVRDDGAT